MTRLGDIGMNETTFFEEREPPSRIAGYRDLSPQEITAIKHGFEPGAIVSLHFGMRPWWMPYWLFRLWRRSTFGVTSVTEHTFNVRDEER
jgi:hypothetical protein